TRNPSQLLAGQPKTFPLHTDNMLGTLCSLLAALTCKEEAVSLQLWPHVPLISVRYGPGFSAPHFTSTCQSYSDCRLIINNVEEGDSAVYYCHTWDDSASVRTTRNSGDNRKLEREQGTRNTNAALVCLARQMSIGFAEVSWLVNGSRVTEGTWTSTAVQHPDKTFQLSSHLSLRACDFSEERSYTCKVTVGSSSFEKTMRMSECRNTVE
uniref:Ig-like domain-containing protein n=1 Tax=Gadus morhua TaxID=8049 RepID=A0A8C4ZS04_GADMO